MKRLVLTTGGTAGHIFPALAVAGEVRRRHPGCEMLFLGGSGPEGALCAKAGVPFRELPAKGVMGKGAAGVLGSLWVVRGLAKALGALRAFRPQVVAGFGGYAGFCPVLAARLLGIPSAVHEQNSVPGVTNRILGRVARLVFLSFADQARAFPASRTRLTGNPVRPEIAAVGQAEKTHFARRLLVLGGSQGARAVNDLVVAALPELGAAGIVLRHQTGAADEARVKRAYAERGADPGQVSGFIEDMAGAYAWADLLLCRAGASTVFEAAAAGRPAVFVPFPFATHNHQEMNARAMAASGGAVLEPQARLTPARLVTLLCEIFGDQDTLRALTRGARAFARTDAAARIADGIEELAARAA